MPSKININGKMLIYLFVYVFLFGYPTAQNSQHISPHQSYVRAKHCSHFEDVPKEIQRNQVTCPGSPKPSITK